MPPQRPASFDLWRPFRRNTPIEVSPRTPSPRQRSCSRTDREVSTLTILSTYVGCSSGPSAAPSRAPLYGPTGTAEQWSITARDAHLWPARGGGIIGRAQPAEDGLWSSIRPPYSPEGISSPL